MAICDGKLGGTPAVSVREAWLISGKTGRRSDEVVKEHWWQHLLHTRRASRLRSALLRYGGSRLVVISIPLYLEEPDIEEAIEEAREDTAVSTAGNKPGNGTGKRKQRRKREASRSNGASRRLQRSPIDARRQ
jgi:hypothetical protein